AERRELPARLLAQIANRQFEAGFGDVCRHGLSHRAQAYKANLGLHKFFYLKCCTSNKDSVELFDKLLGHHTRDESSAGRESYQTQKKNLDSRVRGNDENGQRLCQGISARA